MIIRVGQGFDAHRFQAPELSQRPLILAGIEVAHTQGLEAHSDGDVVIHALCDALLGAAGLPDIGHFFPDTEAQYKNIDSGKLLQKVAQTLQTQGWGIGNIDLTVIAQKPRLSPYIESMKKRLACLLNVDGTAVGIKATTTEHMGFTGRGEGIAALAISLIHKI